MEYRVLGGVAVLRGGEALDLGGRARALLALLLTEANRVVSTDRIIDELWDDTGQDRQNALWVVISRLRTLLEPDRPKRTDGTILVTRPPGYMLVVDPADVDAMRFETLVHEARGLVATDSQAASIVFDEALALWRGHAYEEFTYEPFAEAEIARLTELRLATVEDRVDADLASGRSRDVIAELESLVRLHPRRERLAAQLMLALHRSGRQSEALRSFATYRSYLADELGLDPSDGIVQLEHRIAAFDPSLMLADRAGPAGSVGGGGDLTVRGYELRELIGSGATGDVFVAYQPAVGREVAIKVVHPALVDDADFIRRFEADAQLAASLEHPQIVPVYDYWREADGAYLVMRRFSGGDLEALLRDEPDLSIEQRRRIVGQVTGALAAAHQRGVVHGDVRPANVLIDEHGDAFLADFGFSSGPAACDRRSLRFLAPERAGGGPPSLAADVYALASVAAALIGDAIDERAGRVLDSAMSPDPSARHTDAAAFAQVLDLALGQQMSGGESAASPRSPNPYRGLTAFGESDQAVFFGRERLIERLLAHIGTKGSAGRFLALVGPSGSGKSSVVRAGLIPALRRGAVPGSQHWFITTVMPGRHPFAALARSLRTIAVDPPGDLIEQLRTSGIAATTRSVLADDTAQVVLVIDQLEELFVQSERSEADEFLSAVAVAVTDRHSAVRVVATVRGDFYGEPLRHPEFGELIRLGTDAITPLNPSEIERAITQPAQNAGVFVEPAVVAAIAADMVAQPTALPLMQFALTELYEHRTGTSITLDDYERLGGLSSALAQRADAVLAALDPRRREDARHVLLRLVTVTDGVADARRRVRTSELAATGGDVGQMIDSFVAHRLLSVDRDPETRAPTVEIAHEALLTEWATLRDWIDTARADVREHRRLTEAAAEWRRHGHNADFLLGGDQLAAYGGWTGRTPVRLNANETAFLHASRQHSESALLIEQRRTRRLRRLVAGAAVALVLALIAGGIAVVQQSRAAEARDVAQALQAEAVEQRGIAEQQTIAAESAAETADLERMRAQAVAETDRNPPLAALLAVEAHNIDGSHLSAGAIQQVLTRIDGRRATLFDTFADYGGRNMISSDRSTVAASSTTAVDVWDVDDRSLRLRVDSQFADFDMSADASLLAVKHEPTAGEIVLYDIASHEPVGSIAGQVCSAVRFSPSADRLAIVTTPAEGSFGCGGPEPRHLEIWDVSDPTRPVPEHADVDHDVHEVWWAPDGASYVTASPTGVVRGIDAATHEPIWSHRFELPETNAPDAAMQPVGALFTSGAEQVVVGVRFAQFSGISLFTFDHRSGEIVREPTSTAGLGSMNWWNDEQTQIVGTLWPSGATVLDLDEAAEVVPPPIVNPNATSVWVDRDRNRAIVASFVGIEVFALDGSSVLERRIPLTAEQLAIKSETDGQVFASMTDDGDRVWVTALDFAGRIPVVEWDLSADPPEITRTLPAALISAQGDATVSIDFETVGILGPDHELLGPRTSIEPDRGAPNLWRVASDGSRHAPSRVGTHRLDIYDTATGARITEIDWPGDDAAADVFRTSQFTFSADGDHIATHWLDEHGPVWFVHDTETGEVVHTGRAETDGDLPWLGGETIYTNLPGSFDLERRDVATFEISGPPLVGHTLILNSLLDDLDSDRIVTQATNGNVRVWDRATGDQIGGEIAIGRQSAGTDLFAARDGDLVGILLDAGVAIWNYDVATWPELACQIAGRNLTQREWDDFGPQGAEYRTTCPQFPPGA